MNILWFLIIFILFGACFVSSDNNNDMQNVAEKMEKTKEEWKKELSPEQYHVLREKGTEPAFSGKYYGHHEKGIYLCAACGNELFSSEAKYDSGSGWPSFWAPVREESISREKDERMGMVRTEVKCVRCGSHIGHVFDDGPQPTGLRYCVNSIALEFRPAGE